MQFITRFKSPRSTGAALLALWLLTSCATIDVEREAYQRQLETQLETRNVLQVDVGPEVALSTVGFERLESIIDSAGTAHLAGIDVNGQIHHLNVESSGASHDEVIGALPQTVERNKAALDVVEYPTGTIRIAAGDSEYGRPTSGGAWSRTGGNRCRRYLVHTSSLFCAFVASGEEVGTRPRTDRSGGVIFILPLYWQNTVRPGKLVLAERMDVSWVVRTVIDPATNWSAEETDFAIGMDSQDVVHVVFGASRGGRTFFVGGAPLGAAGAETMGPQVTVDYARFPLPAGGLKGGARSDWQEVESERISAKVPEWGDEIEMPVSGKGGDATAVLRRPYRPRVAVAPNLGVALAVVGVTGGIGTTALGGKEFELVADGFPFASHGDEDHQTAAYLFRIGADDMQHFLLASCLVHILRIECNALAYVRRAEDGKLGTTVLANSKLEMRTTTTLAIGSQGMFAGWVVAGNGLVGRWISSRPAATGTCP